MKKFIILSIAALALVCCANNGNNKKAQEAEQTAATTMASQLIGNWIVTSAVDENGNLVLGEETPEGVVDALAGYMRMEFKEDGFCYTYYKEEPDEPWKMYDKDTFQYSVNEAQSLLNCQNPNYDDDPFPVGVKLDGDTIVLSFFEDEEIFTLTRMQ